jgi:hypothetical protein
VVKREPCLPAAELPPKAANKPLAACYGGVAGALAADGVQQPEYSPRWNPCCGATTLWRWQAKPNGVVKRGGRRSLTGWSNLTKEGYVIARLVERTSRGNLPDPNCNFGRLNKETFFHKMSPIFLQEFFLFL